MASLLPLSIAWKRCFQLSLRFSIGTFRFSALRAMRYTVDLIFEKNLSRWITT